MKEADWNDCISMYSARQITPDKYKAKSLVKTAKARIEFASMQKIDESNACFVFESLYTSLLELLQALVQLDGYNVKNHICIGYYLRDVKKKGELYRKFDDCRFKRNSLVYYGRMMEFESTKASTTICKHCIEQIKLMIEKE